MAEEMEVFEGAVDKVGPWTIKAVANETRKAVVDAAQRENLTVGQWLERRVREWVSPSETPSALAAPRSALVANRADPVALIRLAMDLAAVEQSRDPLIRSARTTVRALLVAARR
jgi:hypothetical protein